jgi:hypothetical protein
VYQTQVSQLHDAGAVRASAWIPLWKGRCSREEALGQAGAVPPARAATETMKVERARSLHVSKLRGVDVHTQVYLKRVGIHYSHQLIALAGKVQKRQSLANSSGIDEAILWRLVRRADIAQVCGIGMVFSYMLELIDIDRVSRLAREEPAALHRRLVEFNAREHIARRAPTVEEVADWVHQARALPDRLEDDGEWGGFQS